MNRKRTKIPTITTEPAPPHVRKSGETQTMLVDRLLSEVASARDLVLDLCKQLNMAAEGGSRRPLEILAGSSRSVEIIAAGHVAEEAIRSLIGDNPLTIAGLAASATRQVLRLSTSMPACSTSPMSNIMESCKLAALARLACQLTDWADSESQEVT